MRHRDKLLFAAAVVVSLGCMTHARKSYFADSDPERPTRIDPTPVAAQADDSAVAGPPVVPLAWRFLPLGTRGGTHRRDLALEVRDQGEVLIRVRRATISKWGLVCVPRGLVELLGPGPLPFRARSGERGTVEYLDTQRSFFGIHFPVRRQTDDR